MSFISYAILNKYLFFTSNFSAFEHPTYFSMKILWVLILIKFYFVENYNRLVIIFISLFLSMGIFLLASKAGIIFWLLMALFLTYCIINKIVSRRVPKYLIMSAISLVLVTASFAVAKEIVRINEFLNQMEKGFSQSEIDLKNLDQRTREWYCALQLIKEKPIFGHGIGRVEDRMVEEYLKNRWEEEARLRYNAHNQFLETQMTFGIPGTLSLLWMLFTPLIFRKRLMYPKLATAFVFMMTFFLIFESMFVRQWGIMFFTLFYCILVIPSDVEDNLPVNHTALKNY